MNNKRLEEFDLIIGDGNYSSKYPKSEEFLIEGIPFLSASDFTDKTIDYNNSKKISPELHCQLRKGHVQKGDLLIVVRGNGVGKTGFIDDEIDECNINAQLAFIRSNDPNLDNEYLYYNMKCNYEKLRSLATGSAQPQLVIGNLVKYSLTVPLIEKQIKIRTILSNIDKKIKINNEINNNLFELVLNNFNDFLDRNKDAEIVKLEDCVEKINTGADAIQRAPIVDYDTGIRCIRIGDMTNGRDYHNWGFTKMTNKDFENYKLIRNDIVITRTAVNGLTYMITDEENTVCNNGNIRLRVNTKYNPLYVYLNTKTKDFRNYIDRINSETSVRPNMKVDYFTSYEIKKIDLEKQNDFCLRAESIMKKIQNNKVENYNLEELRDTLLPKLMNGEIDLDNIEI